MPAAVQARLWSDADGRPAYAILDGACDDRLLDALHAEGAPRWRGLLPGLPAADLAAVAPYLVELECGSTFTRRLLDEGWGRHLGVFVTGAVALPALWRHLRRQVLVDGPDLEPLYFRFYDPRVLRSFLSTGGPRQLAGFFGPVHSFVAEDEDPARGVAWSFAAGQVVAQTIG